MAVEEAEVVSAKVAWEADPEAHQQDRKAHSGDPHAYPPALSLSLILVRGQARRARDGELLDRLLAAVTSTREIMAAIWSTMPLATVDTARTIRTRRCLPIQAHIANTLLTTRCSS